MLFLPWCHADRTQGLLRGDSEHKDQGPRVQVAPQQVFPCNISSLQATLLRFSKVAKAKGVNTNPTSGPPGDCRVSRGPSPPSHLHPWDHGFGEGHAHRHVLLCVWLVSANLVVRPWMPNVSNYRSPHPVAEGICLWECIPWMGSELGIKTTGLPRTSGTESWSWHSPRGVVPSPPASIYNWLFHTKVAETISHHEEASGPPTIHHFFNWLDTRASRETGTKKKKARLSRN